MKSLINYALVFALAVALGVNLGFGLGVVTELVLAQHQTPPPVPAPTPSPHLGHFTVSYVEGRYDSPRSAAVRDALAAFDWHSLDATFRAYIDGQDELTSLGFVPHFTTADLPLLFIQETGTSGAPIIDTIKSPATADRVIDRVKELRGQ